MNTEDRLHRASAEMERVTASLTPPPIGEVRRSARLRAASVAIVAAVGVALVVGGAVLALRPNGEAMLSPAGPNETTVAPIVVDGIPVVIPDLDPAPQFDLDQDVHQHTWQPPGASVETVSGLIDDPGQIDDWLDEINHVVFAGGSGEYAAFELTGEYGPGAGVGQTGLGACLTTYGLGELLESSCGSADERGLLWGIVDLSGGPTFIVAGRAHENASVVVLEVDGSRIWSRTRDGYVVMAVDGQPDSVARYYVYDKAGKELEATTFHEGDDVTDTAPAVTVAPAIEDDGSCSAVGHYSDQVLSSDLPEPVIQTLGKILLFADRCWFDELAGVAAENFTASFGGMDPVELWTFEEEQGSEPMAALMQILDMPYGTSEVEGRVLYIWPAAAAHDGDWDSMPQEDKDALLSLYTDQDLAAFSDWGGYIGYRLGIYEDGDWSFFVAGD